MTTSYHYFTKFVGYTPYYVFTSSIRSKKILGYLPAGVTYTYRGRTYDTAHLLSAINQLWRNDRFNSTVVPALLSTAETWQHSRDQDRKRIFIHLARRILS